MSDSDLWMRDTVATCVLILTTILCALFLVTWKWSKLRKTLYKSHLVGFEQECAELAVPYKKRLFKVLRQMVSSDEILRSMGCIRVLEIGVKTGENLQFYPEGTHFIGVDWNVKLGDYLLRGKRSWQFSHVVVEKLIVGDGSNLKEIPTSFVDAVVSTRALCSVRSVRSTLREIRRVLAPGGKYLFMEHIAEKESSFIRWLQITLTRSGFWPSLYDGCRLDLDFNSEFEAAEFERLIWTTIKLEGFVLQPLHLKLSGLHVLGMATK